MKIYVDEMFSAIINSLDKKEAILIKEEASIVKMSLSLAFVKAYMRPIVSGGEKLRPKSGLRGIDQYGNNLEVDEEFPESIGIRQAMKKLFGRGLRPFDVHSENVMMRPSTGDIVVVDLGRFKVFNPK